METVSGTLDNNARLMQLIVQEDFIVVLYIFQINYCEIKHGHLERRDHACGTSESAVYRGVIVTF
jgi:hypothetical protein